MKKLIFIILFLFLAVNLAYAGTMYSLSPKKIMRISGKITDVDSGYGISEVSITSPTSATISRYDGQFKIDFKVCGTFQLRFEKKGYITKTLTLFPKTSGMGINVKLKQKMGTLYGMVRGCYFDGKNHHYDDMSKTKVIVKGKAISGQKIMLQVTPQKNGKFIVFNLPIGKYKVIADHKSKNIVVKKNGEAVTVSIITRWCMRKEFHTEKEEQLYLSDKYLKEYKKNKK